MSLQSPPPRFQALAKSEWELLLYFWRVGEGTIASCHKARQEIRPDLRFSVTYIQVTRVVTKGWLLLSRVDSNNTNYYKPTLSFEAAIKWLGSNLFLEPRDGHPAFLKRAAAALSELLAETPRAQEALPRRTKTD